MRSTISSQVNEYDQSIHELKQVVMKEREEKSKEVSYLKQELFSKEDDIEALMEALEKTKKNMQTLEKKYESELNIAKNKEDSLIEQLRSAKNNEKNLKEEMSSFYKIAEKYESLKKQIDKEFGGIKEELDQAIQIISRQENYLQDLRLIKKEDDTKITNLLNEVENKQQEIKRIQTINLKLAKKEKEQTEKNVELEYKIKSLTLENSSIRAEFQNIYDRQEKERDERKKLAKRKIDLLTQRNEEITRLNQAFNTFDT